MLSVSFMKSFVDNVFRETVEPVPGSVVYCDLGLIPGYTVKHSGIYIGDDKIVHLDGSGKIEVVDDFEFKERLHGWNMTLSIYVSSSDSEAVGSNEVAKRAKQMVGNNRDYNLLLDNCHQFTSGCLTGDFENHDNFLWLVKDKAKEQLNANEWRVWL